VQGAGCRVQGARARVSGEIPTDANGKGWYARAAKRTAGLLRTSGEFKKKENASASPQMRRALEFSGLGVEPWEVALLSFAAAVISAAIIISLAIISIVILGIGLFPAGLGILLLSTAAPLAILAFLAEYPKRLAERRKVQSLGRMPEAVNYMVMSMRNSPSLDRAVTFAADNTDEPLAEAST